MSARQRVTNEQVVAAYQRTGSVWRAARELGIVGQSVWERLRALGIKLPGSKWTDDEVEELRALAGTMPLGEIARRLGRPYAATACKLSELGISAARPRERKVPRGVGLNKATVAKLMREAEADPRGVTQFCRSRRLNVDTFVLAAQKYEPDRFRAYAAARSPLPSRECAYCTVIFIPSNGKQRTCSRKCQSDLRADRTYFGGKRRSTIGLAERTCQCCHRVGVKGLSSHHMLGKQNDPENDFLIAVCPGCHAAIGSLAQANFTATSEGWENLIGLVMLRKLADLGNGKAGAHVTVDIDWLSHEDAAEMIEREEEP